MQSVPALSHLLEATATESALDICRRVVVISLLASSRNHPRLLYLEVVRHVHLAPLTIIQTHSSTVLHVARLEAPPLVQQLHTTLRHSRSKTHCSHRQQSPKFSFHHFDLFVFSNCDSTFVKFECKFSEKTAIITIFAVDFK